MLSDQVLHIIESLAQGKTLNDEDQRIYNQYKEDPEFINELAFRKDLQISLTSIARDKMKAHLNNLDAQKQPRSFNYKRLALFIIIALGISFLLYNLLYSKEKKLEYIYAQYFEPYPNIVDPITKGEPSSESGYLEYEKKNYDKALELLLKNDDVNALFYKGMIYNLKNMHSEAKDMYIEALSKGDESMRAKIEWHLCLTYFKLGEYDLAKKLLVKISSEMGHFYAPDAEAILREFE